MDNGVKTMGDEGHVCACGMHLCKKCSPVILLFGLLFLVAGFGLWAGAPMWWNGWTLIGVFMLLWGIMAFVMK